MYGNVWEWCFDFADQSFYQSSPRPNPVQMRTNSMRSARGGSFDFSHLESRSAVRGFWNVKNPIEFMGFRVARTIIVDSPVEADESERSIAEWILNRGGEILIDLEDSEAGTTVSSTDELPDESFTLRHVLLPDSTLGDDELALIAQTRGIEELILDHNVHPVETQVTDAGLAHLVSLDSLEKLVVASHGITDAGFDHLGSLSQLGDLRLRSDSISGSGVAHLEDLSHLEQLRLSSSSLTDAAVGPLSRLH